MNKYKRRISILLIMTMIITTLSFCFVVAEEIPGSTDNEQVQEGGNVPEPQDINGTQESDLNGINGENQGTDPENPGEGIVPGEGVTPGEGEDPDEGEEPIPFAITDVKAELMEYLGRNAVIKVVWDSTEDAEFIVTPYDGEEAIDAEAQTLTLKEATFTLPVGTKYRFVVSASVNEETISSDPSNEIDAKEAAISGLNTHPSYCAVVLDWIKSPSAFSYAIEYASKSDFSDAKTVEGINNNENESKYDTNRVLYEIKGLEEFKTYYFRVSAFYEGEESAAVVSNTVSNQPVRPITYNLVIKKNVPYGTLKRKNSTGPYSVKLTKNQTVKAIGFNSGKYVFEVNGAVFNIVKSRIKKVTCSYNKTLTYDRISAESYVNGKGLSSATKQLIWVNTYTQELYVFNGSKGNWTQKDHWSVSTGKASSPTPTGNYGIKKVWKFIKKRHNLKWWTCFSNYNAFHSLFNSWKKKIGTPASGGCVRNPVNKAEWIYKNIKKNTAVFIR